MKKLKNDTIEIIILLCCIMILIGLIVRINLDSKEKTCDKCNITLKQTRADQLHEYVEEFDVKIINLYKSYSEGGCYVSWDTTLGWIINE